jgi:UPF0716 family protein affecting phage T7 exclusion
MRDYTIQCLIGIVLAVAIWILGFVTGAGLMKREYRKTVIQMGFACYNSTNGTLQWNTNIIGVVPPSQVNTNNNKL